MSSSPSDRNVLFGVLVLQAWTLQKSRPLDELLVELGHMSAEDRAALEPMVDRHVARHGGSAEQSLTALSSVSEVAEELQELHDVDLPHSFTTTGELEGISPRTSRRTNLMRRATSGG